MEAGGHEQAHESLVLLIKPRLNLRHPEVAAAADAEQCSRWHTHYCSAAQLTGWFRRSTCTRSAGAMIALVGDRTQKGFRRHLTAQQCSGAPAAGAADVLFGVAAHVILDRMRTLMCVGLKAHPEPRSVEEDQWSKAELSWSDRAVGTYRLLSPRCGC